MIDTLDGFERKTATAIYTDYCGEFEAIEQTFADGLLDSGAEVVARATPRRPR